MRVFVAQRELLVNHQTRVRGARASRIYTEKCADLIAWGRGESRERGQGRAQGGVEVAGAGGGAPLPPTPSFWADDGSGRGRVKGIKGSPRRKPHAVVWPMQKRPVMRWLWGMGAGTASAQLSDNYIDRGLCSRPRRQRGAQRVRAGGQGGRRYGYPSHRRRAFGAGSLMSCREALRFFIPRGKLRLRKLCCAIHAAKCSTTSQRLSRSRRVR